MSAPERARGDEKGPVMPGLSRYPVKRIRRRRSIFDWAPAFAGETRGAGVTMRYRSYQFLIQIMPVRIHQLDHLYLPRPLPVLDGLFPLNGRLHGGVQLIPNQGVHAVFIGETFDNVIFVLPNALQEIRGHACIQGSIAFAG